MTPEHLSFLAAHRRDWLSCGREGDGVELAYVEGGVVKRVWLPVPDAVADAILEGTPGPTPEAPGKIP